MLKDDAEHPIPERWRQAFRDIAKAFVAGDFELSHHSIDGARAVPGAIAHHIAANVTGYGDALAPLDEATWDRSAYR